MKDVCPNYKDLTSDDFIIEITFIDQLGCASGSLYYNPSKTYNNSNGQLNINNSGCTMGSHYINANVYLLNN